MSVLQRHNISGTALKWFFKDLRGRALKCASNGKVSDTFQPSMGVPRRSVLGPILYNHCVSDLADIAQQFGTYWYFPSFADDVTMYCRHEACSTLSTALGALHQALAERGLSVNTDKTVSMVISPLSCTHTDPPSPITCHGRKIKAVTKTQLLGVTVHNKLSWEAHVDSVQAKVNRKIGALRRPYRQLTPVAHRSYFTAVI